MIKHLLNQSDIQKYTGLGTQNVKIGPFLWILGLETAKLPFKIYRDCDFLTLNLLLSLFLCSYMIKHHLNRSGMKKYIALGTQNVKIGPFSWILGLETAKFPFKIYRDCDLKGNFVVSRPKIHENSPILTFWVPISMYFFMLDRLRWCLIM